MIVAMPTGIDHHNADSHRCDMAVGPCSCGAWHSIADWPAKIQAAIRRAMKAGRCVVASIISIACLNAAGCTDTKHAGESYPYPGVLKHQDGTEVVAPSWTNLAHPPCVGRVFSPASPAGPASSTARGAE